MTVCVNSQIQSVASNSCKWIVPTHLLQTLSLAQLKLYFHTYSQNWHKSHSIAMLCKEMTCPNSTNTILNGTIYTVFEETCQALNSLLCLLLKHSLKRQLQHAILHDYN